MKVTSKPRGKCARPLGMRPASPQERAAVAGRLLEHLFASLETPLAFRLWDGTTVRVGGAGDGGCTVVFRSREVFRRLVRRPTPLRFGEAYIASEIDIEGDLFAAMRAAIEIEALRVPVGTKLRVLAGMLRV